jgi:hypothetical protein
MTQAKVIRPRTLSFIGLLLALVLPTGGITTLGKEPSVLNLGLEAFKVEKTDMEGALKQLRQLEPRILIGFEKLPQFKGVKETSITLELAHTTVGETLNLLCVQDARYIYELVNGNLINVFPVGAKADNSNLLNLFCKKARIHVRRAPGAVVQNIRRYIPELDDYLEMKAKAHSLQTGIKYGTVGVEMHGNMDPDIHLELENLTVRDVLNRLVLHSIPIFQKLRWDPQGWKYEFIIDPEAATGLGGYPSWDSF